MSVLRKYLPQFVMVFSSALWGASFIFTKGLFLGEPDITPSIILTGRMLIATVFTMPLLLAMGKLERIRREHLKFFLLLSFFEPFVYSICETSGVKFVSGSLASIIIATIPLFIPFGMAAVYKEKVRGRAIIGIVLSLSGIALMSLNEDFSFTASPKGLLLLGAAVIIAVFYTLTLVRVLDHYRPMTITTWQNFFALFMFTPLMIVCDRESLATLSYGWQMWMMLAFLGILCSTVAYMCFNYGMKHLGATRGSVYNNLIPVFSLVLAMLMGQERPGWMQYAGMAVVLIGLTVAQSRGETARHTI